MTTGARIVAIAFGGALCLATSTGLSAADPWSVTTMKPLAASSLDAGKEHILSYFLSREGVCKLTLMIDEASADQAAEAGSRVSRLQLTVEPGRAAKLDVADGKSFRFACLGRAQAMSVTKIDHVALDPFAD